MLLSKVYWPWKGNVKGAFRFLITFPNPTGVPSLRFFKLPWSLLHFFNYPYLLSWKRSLCRNETRRNDPHVFLPNYSPPPPFSRKILRFFRTLRAFIEVVSPFFFFFFFFFFLFLATSLYRFFLSSTSKYLLLFGTRAC